MASIVDKRKGFVPWRTHVAFVAFNVIVTAYVAKSIMSCKIKLLLKSFSLKKSPISIFYRHKLSRDIANNLSFIDDE